MKHRPWKIQDLSVLASFAWVFNRSPSMPRRSLRKRLKSWMWSRERSCFGGIRFCCFLMHNIQDGKMMQDISFRPVKICSQSDGWKTRKEEESGNQWSFPLPKSLEWLQSYFSRRRIPSEKVVVIKGLNFSRWISSSPMGEMKVPCPCEVGGCHVWSYWGASRSESSGQEAEIWQIATTRRGDQMRWWTGKERRSNVSKECVSHATSLPAMEGLLQTLPTYWGWQARTKGCSTQEDWTWGATPCLQLQIISSALGTWQIFDILDIPGILLQRVRVASVRRCQALSGHLWFPADRAVLCCPLSLAMKEKEIQLKEESKALEGPFSQNESWDEN